MASLTSQSGHKYRHDFTFFANIYQRYVHSVMWKFFTRWIFFSGLHSITNCALMTTHIFGFCMPLLLASANRIGTVFIVFTG